MSTSKFIGVNLGTSYSSAAIYKNGQVELVKIDGDTQHLPSVVAFPDSGILIGKEAENAENRVFNIKRLIGKRYDDFDFPAEKDFFGSNKVQIKEQNSRMVIEVQYGEESVTFLPEEITALILRKLKSEAENNLGSEVSGAVITVPASFTNNQRKATKNAATIAGFEHIRLLNETTAATIAHVHKIPFEGQSKRFLVVDISDADLNASLISVADGSKIKVLSTVGNDQLGRIEEYFDAQADFSDPDQYTSSDSGESCDELSDRILKTVEQLFLDSSSDGSSSNLDITCDVLISATTQYPKLQKKIVEYLASNINSENFILSEDAVAQGAALLAAKFDSIQDDFTKNLKLIDIIPMTITSSLKNYRTMFEKYSSTLIGKLVTVEVEETFVIYQVIDRTKEIVLGTYQVSDISFYRSAREIDLTFDIDENGILKVNAIPKYNNCLSKPVIHMGEEVLTNSEVKLLRKRSEEIGINMRSDKGANNHKQSYCESVMSAAKGYFPHWWNYKSSDQKPQYNFKHAMNEITIKNHGNSSVSATPDKENPMPESNAIAKDENTLASYDPEFSEAQPYAITNRENGVEPDKLIIVHKAKTKTENVSIGISFGTKSCCTGVYRNKKFEMIPNEWGDRSTPSVVAFEGKQLLVGSIAANQRPQNSENTVFNVKGFIGKSLDDEEVMSDMKYVSFAVKKNTTSRICFGVNVEGRENITPEEICAIILQHQKNLAEKYLNCPVNGVVITVPALFTNSQREATRDAAIIAGFENIRLINESTAVALAHGVENTSNYFKKETILIFNLGGGSMDASVVEISNKSKIKVIATSGNTHLGGEDFDQRLFDYFASEFERDHNEDLKVSLQARRKLQTACQKIKSTLTHSKEARIEIDDLLNDIDFESTITREKFEELCGDLFDQINNVCDNVLLECEQQRTSFSDVLIVGGASYIPKVVENLKTRFANKKFKFNINREEAAVHGAAIIASNSIDEKINDVVGINIGVSIDNNPIQKVIFRNTSIEESGRKISEAECSFFEIYEISSKLTSIGIRYKPFGRLFGIDIDHDGIVRVSATDGNSKRFIVFVESSKLYPNEIYAMKRKMHQIHEDNKEHHKFNEMMDRLEGRVIAMKKFMQKNGHNLTSDQINYIHSVYSEAKECIQNGDINVYNSIMEKCDLVESKYFDN